MKTSNLFIITLLCPFLFFVSCQNNNTRAEVLEEEVIPKSPYFERVVFADGADFLGLELGEAKENALEKLPSEVVTESTPNYTYFKWQLDTNVYYIDLYFNEEEVLASIDGYVYFYTTEKNYDNAAASLFYANLKEYFQAKYGEKEETEGEATYTQWDFDNKTIEVGLNEGEVYWFILLKQPAQVQESV